jgi:hypothetical protein
MSFSVKKLLFTRSYDEPINDHVVDETPPVVAE